MQAPHWLLTAATLAYASAMLLTIMRLVQRQPTLRSANYVAILTGWLLQSGGVWLLGMQAAACPIRNPFEILQFIAWSIVSLYLFAGPIFRLSFFGTGSAALAALLSISAFAFLPSSIAAEPRPVMNPLVEAHAATALFSYGIFGLLAVLSSLFIIQNQSLKHKTRAMWLNQLPSIVDMERVIGRLLLIGCTVFTGAMLIGAADWLRHPEVLGSSKLILTVLLWLAVLIITGLQLSGRLYGNRLASTTIFLFIFALLILWPVEADRNPRPATAYTAPSALPTHGA
jgi:ABC-type uncharacterized transport system permease subunit